MNTDDVILEEGGIVYETGDFKNAAWKDFQKIGPKVYIRTASIEAYTKGK